MSFVTGTSCELIYCSSAAGTAKNTFTSEVSINDTAGMGPFANIPPYFFNANPNNTGRALHIIARGIVSSTGTPTFTFTIRSGTQANTSAAIILGTAALTTASGITNQLWELEGDVVLVTQGAAGANSTVRGTGMFRSGGGFASPFMYAAYGGAATPGTVATFDMSVTNYLNFNVTCSASSGSNGVTLQQLMLFGLN